MKKKIAIVSLLMAMVLLLTACGSKDSGSTPAAAAAPNIEGTWELVDAKAAGTEEDIASALALIKTMGGSMTMTFKDGKMTMNMEFMGQTESSESTYTIEDGKLVSDGSKLDINLDGDTLVLSEGENSITLKRKQ